MIEVRDLTRRDAKTNRLLLSGVNLTIGAGEQIGLIGPSGSGKSSLLRVIARLDRFDSGELLYCGQPVCGDDVPRYRRRVVYLPQQASLLPGTVRDNLQLPFQLATAEDEFPQADVAAWLQALSPSGQRMLDQSADALSGGERQIVALIRALTVSPQALLLDEPTAGLDAEAVGRFERQVQAWLDSGSSQPRALVWTSHDANQVERMTGRTVQMRDGALTRGDGDA